VEIDIDREEDKDVLICKTLLVVALPPLKEYAKASPVLEAALTTTAAAVRAELY
jgi:hypothetical protein